MDAFSVMDRVALVVQGHHSHSSTPIGMDEWIYNITFIS